LQARPVCGLKRAANALVPILLNDVEAMLAGVGLAGLALSLDAMAIDLVLATDSQVGDGGNGGLLGHAWMVFQVWPCVKYSKESVTDTGHALRAGGR
jgi:hypothetical protein